MPTPVQTASAEGQKNILAPAPGHWPRRWEAHGARRVSARHVGQVGPLGDPLWSAHPPCARRPHGGEVGGGGEGLDAEALAIRLAAATDGDLFLWLRAGRVEGTRSLICKHRLGGSFAPRTEAQTQQAGEGGQAAEDDDGAGVAFHAAKEDHRDDGGSDDGDD